MRNPFRRKRLDREALVAGLSPRVAEFWPPFWADYEMGDGAWFASFIGWVSGTEKALAALHEALRNARPVSVGTQLHPEHLREALRRL